MLKKLKQTRKAFNIYMMIAGLVMMATTGAVVVPSAQNYYTKQRVEETVAKEKLLKDIYMQYFTQVDIANARDFIDKAIENGILLENAKTDANGNDTFPFLDNGFGGEFKIRATRSTDDDPAQFFIISEMRNKNIGTFAEIAYTNSIASNDGVTVNGVENTYTFVNMNDEEKAQRVAKDIIAKDVDKKDIENNANHLTEEDALALVNDADKAGKEWWDYNSTNNMFAVKTWDTTKGNWETTGWKTTDGKGVDGKYYVDNIGDKKADEVASGTRIIVQEDGKPIEYVSINGAWVKEAAIKSEFASIPDENLERFKDMLDRQSSKNYFNARDTSVANVSNIWGNATVKFTKTTAYWKSEEIRIPHYKTPHITGLDTDQHIYLADNLNWLSTGEFNEGDVAFLRKNNDYKVGYKGIQESDNTREKLYPEAIYHNGGWIYYAPTIGDVLRLGFDEGEYYAGDIAKVLYLGGYDNQGDGNRWWSDVENSDTRTYRDIIATQGDRIHFPNIGSAIYNNASLYISANMGDIELYPTYSRSGAKSIYKYDSANLFYEWGFVDGRDAEITNFLSDVVEGQEIVVNSVTSGNQSEQQILQLVPSIGDNKGKILIVYSGENINGDRDIFGKIYDGDGIVLVDEFAINNTTVGEQTSPKVTLLSNNNFAVTWVSEGEIMAKVIDSEGIEVVADMIVYDVNQNSSNPQIATLLNGKRFVIVWENDSDIKCSVYSYAGVEYKAPFLVNLSNQTGLQINPKIIVAPYVNEKDKKRVTALGKPNTCIIVWEDKANNNISANLYKASDFTIKNTNKLTNIAGKTDISNLSVGFTYQSDYMYHIIAQSGAEVFVHTFIMKRDGSVEIDKKLNIKTTGSNPSFIYVFNNSDTTHRHVLVYEDGNNIKQNIYYYEQGYSKSRDFIIQKDSNLIINTKYNSGENPQVSYVMANVYVVTWEAPNIGVVAKVMRTTTKDTAGASKKHYYIPDEFLVNNKQSDFNPKSVRVASIQDYSAGTDAVATGAYRYIAITWDGYNTDTNSNEVSARFYDISNFRWLEGHN